LIRSAISTANLCFRGSVIQRNYVLRIISTEPEIDIQYVTDDVYSVNTIQSTIVRTDISRIDQASSFHLILFSPTFILISFMPIFIGYSVLDRSCIASKSYIVERYGLTMTSYPVGNKTSLSRQPCIPDKTLLRITLRKPWSLFQNRSWKFARSASWRRNHDDVITGLQ